MTVDKFQKEIISDFWTFVSAHNVCVDWQGGELLMWVEAENIKAFGETFGIQDDTVLEKYARKILR